MLTAKMKRLGTIAGDPRWWRFYAQRVVMHPLRRGRIADLLARVKPSAPAAQELNVGVADLKGGGIHMLGDLITEAQCAELVSWFKQRPVNDTYRPGAGSFLPMSDERHPDAHVAHHTAADIVRAPYLFDLANDPRIIETVTAFFGCKPTIGYMAAWWSYHTDKGAQQAENFHRDVDDWRFIKLFLYLTEVGPESGPHKYVRGSWNDPRLSEIRRFSDEEVEETFGAGNVLTMTGPAGTGFLENTFGIHKGQPVKEGTRLLFQVVYTLNPLPYAPAKPVIGRDELARNSYDPWINRVYVA